VTFRTHLTIARSAPWRSALGDSLASTLRGTRRDLFELGLDLNEQIRVTAGEGDRLAKEIAELNTEIAAVEAGGSGQANALRDRRDALLRELSEIFDVIIREQPSGAINVYIGSEPLIQSGSTRGITTSDEVDGEFVRTVVRFRDTNARINVAGGMIEGHILARDQQAFARMQELDDLASAIITEVNRLHADGQGLTQLTFGPRDRKRGGPGRSAEQRGDAGLRNPPVDGSFYITVADDATGRRWRIASTSISTAPARTPRSTTDRCDQRGRQRRYRLDHRRSTPQSRCRSPAFRSASGTTAISFAPTVARRSRAWASIRSSLDRAQPTSRYATNCNSDSQFVRCGIIGKPHR
jgi:flagellar hook-associated protein FlgK